MRFSQPRLPTRSDFPAKLISRAYSPAMPSGGAVAAFGGSCRCSGLALSARFDPKQARGEKTRCGAPTALRSLPAGAFCGCDVTAQAVFAPRKSLLEPRRGGAGVVADGERHRRRAFRPAEVGVGGRLEGVRLAAGLGNRCVDGQAADHPEERVGRRGGLREGTGGMVTVKVPILSVTAWVDRCC